MKCKFCNHNFLNKHTLNTHQHSAKYCLKIQKKDFVSDYKCKGCHKTFTTIYDLNIHKKTCKTLPVVYELHNKIQNITKKLEEKEILIKNLQVRVRESQTQIQNLQDKLENIAIKAVSRPTTTMNMNRTQVNNYIQNMQPISPDQLLEHANNLTLEHIQKGASGYAEYALEYPLKDRVACVDYSRRKIKFKNSDGDLITDPEMVKLAPMFFDSIKEKSSEIVYKMNKPDMDSYMFEEVAKLFNTNSDVKNGACGLKSDFYHDFVKHVCSRSVQE